MPYLVLMQGSRRVISGIGHPDIKFLKGTCKMPYLVLMQGSRRVISGIGHPDIPKGQEVEF